MFRPLLLIASSLVSLNEIEKPFRKLITARQRQSIAPMRVCISLVLGLLIGGSCWSFAQDNPVYSVTGIAVGSRVDFDSEAYKEYRCAPSEVFNGLTLCAKKTDDTEQRGPYVAYDGLLHSSAGTVISVSRYQDPAYWPDGEVRHAIEYFSRRLGKEARILAMPIREGLPNGIIAMWGQITLESVDDASRTLLAAGKNPSIGVLVDFLGNFERSTKNGLPVYRVSGGTGLIWAASYDSNGRGTLRMLAINPSNLPKPVNLKSPNQAEANHSDSNPLAAFAQKSLDASVNVGFFVSAEGHILTNAGMISDCPSIISSHGGHIRKLAVDETSDLALLMSSEKPHGWASFRGGSEPRIAERLTTIGFPTGTISALTGLGNDHGMMRINTPIQVDNSGSPLLDRSGNVVGVAGGKLNSVQLADRASETTENINFAVSLRTIQSFLDSHAVPYVVNEGTQSKKYLDIAAEAMRYTVVLECER
jgi:S1-C subfamily serine protease